jgi:adenylate cyclase
MTTSTPLTTRMRQAQDRLSGLLASHWKNRFYLWLAAIFSLFAVLDTTALHLTANMRQAAFDAMVRYRIVVPKPDPDIVIVDINEASLSAMAKEYGRWPWPRQVLGEFLEHLEQQGPKAVVFDILFSDPDVYNPDSDAYFDQAVAATNNTYFPMLRLDPASDALSQIKPGMIPGVTAIPGEAQPNATVAVVLPHFQSVLRGGRLGLHNIYPDPDGIARQYLVYRDDYGWKLPSLPLRLAQGLGWQEPAVERVLLNWRGQPFSYRYVTFSDVFADMTSKAKKRPQDEFRGKIVVIGSTAPSLFDLKPTPMNRMHPGVEILATAIDNLKHGDYLRFPEAPVSFLLLTLAIVWVTAWGFYREAGRDKIDRLFGAAQFILLGVSYASINFTNTYINLTGPVMVGVAFFTIARVYATATGRALERSVVRRTVEQGEQVQAFLMLVRLGAPGAQSRDKVLEKIRLRLEKAGSETKSVEVLKGRQRGVWGLLENILAVSWAVPVGDREAPARIARDAEAVMAALSPLLHKYFGSDQATWYLHQGAISGGAGAQDEWRALLAEALLRWKEQARNGGNTA